MPTRSRTSRPTCPHDVVQDIIEAQDVEDRAELQAALSYPEGTVGALMDFEVVSIREDVTCEVALRYLRRFDELPHQTDAVFVVDRADHLKGALPLNRLLVTDPDVEVAGLYDRDVTTFAPEDDSDEAAEAFDRYDLVCAPVLDGQGRLIGRITVDTVLEYVRDRQEQQDLGKVGLREEEDLFSSVWASAKNRGPWLALNLCTAFIASRVVGAFEGSIEKLAALAALMPIVAGIGGNSAQPDHHADRALAGPRAGQRFQRAPPAAEGARHQHAERRHLGRRARASSPTCSIATWRWAGVMALAMLLNLLVAALAGIFIPLAMERFGRDPAVGSSVFLTFVTDSMGFFIFLGLATISCSAMPRLFYAIWPDDNAKRGACGACRGARARLGGRPVPAENIHLTLAFLGTVADERVAEAMAVRVRGPSIRFPPDFVDSFRGARVGWAGIEPVPGGW